MYFCESCEMVLDTAGHCPRCGAKEMRPIKANDPIFITRMPFAWSGVFADILREEEIPFRTRSVLGTYLAYYFGRIRDDDEFYVCWGDYVRAKQLAELVKAELIDPDADGAFDVESPDDEYDDYDPDEESADPTPEQERRRPFGF